MKVLKKISLGLIIVMIFQLIVIAPNAFALESNYSDYSIFIRDLNAINYPESITVSGSVKNANMTTYNKYKLVVYGNLGEYSSKKDIAGEYEYLGWNKNGQAQPNSKYQGTGTGTESFNQVLYVSTDMSGNSITTQARNSWKNLTNYEDYNLKEQLLYNGAPTGVNVNFITQDKTILLQPATLISNGSVRVYFTSKDGSNKRYATLTIPAIPYKNITSCQLNSDKTMYLMPGDKDDIDISIGASAFVNPLSNNFTKYFIFGLTARITSLEINGVEVASSYKGTFDDNFYGATITQNFQVDTGLKPLNIKRSQLKEGVNTIIFKGYASMETFNNLNDTVYTSKPITITVDKKLVATSLLEGQIITDKASYSCKNTDISVTIQAKEQTNLTIDDVSRVSDLGAKVVSYSINGGADVSINNTKTSSSIKTIETDYAALNLNVGSLNNGNNTINIKGYSWWKDNLGTLKEVNTTKTVIVTKSETSKPVAVIEAPINVHAGNTVTVKGSGSDPNGLAITEYSWTTSNGQPLTGTGGNIKVDAQVTLTLKVKNSENVWSDSVTHIVNTENEPPTVRITAPLTVYAGDDVYVNGYAQDKDGDMLEYNWDAPSDMYGDLEGTFGIVYFMDLGIKNFGLTVADASGESASASAQTNVIAPTPTVNILQTGTLKENRKVIIDTSNSNGGSKRATIISKKYVVTGFNGTSMNDVKIQSHTVGSTNGSILYDSSRGINNSLDGLDVFDMTFKKPGQYKIQCSITNSFGITSSTTITLNIIVDEPPMAGLAMPEKFSRDHFDPNKFNGLAYAIVPFIDAESGDYGCYSTDGDTIEKRSWFFSFDANNNDIIDDIWYPYNASTNKWDYSVKYTYNQAKNFDLDKFPVGNLKTVTLETAHVGVYYGGIICKESFGQDYIPQFVTDADRKIGKNFD